MRVALAAALACAVAVIAGSVYLIRSELHNAGVKTESGQIISLKRQGQASQLRAPQPQSADQLSEVPPSVARPRKAPFVLLLGTGVLRGAAALRSVTLPRGIDSLNVQILLGSDETAQRYDIKIESAQGAVIKSVKGLAPEAVLSQRLLRFQIRAAGLATGVYDFKVYREGAPSTRAASYRVQIVRPAG